MDDVISGNDNEPATKGEPITITLAHHTAELADIRGHIKDKMVTREEFHARMDGFSGRTQDFE